MQSTATSNEAERIRAADEFVVLDKTTEGVLERLCHLARNLFRVPIAYIAVLGADRQRIVAASGATLSHLPRDAAFCSQTILADDITVIEDARADARFATTPLVAGPPFVRFYAGVPLSTEPGLRIGTFCVIDTEPRVLSDEDRGVLRSLGSIAENALRSEKNARHATGALGQWSHAERITRAGSWRYDLAADKATWSDGMYELFDYAPSEVTPGIHAILDRTHPDDRDRIRETALQAAASQRSFEMQYRIILRDGSIRWVEDCATVLNSETGGPLFVGTMRDVTDLRYTTEQLADREERYRALTEASSAAIWRADAKGTLTETWGWDKLTGASFEECRGDRWLNWVHPDDRGRVSAGINDRRKHASIYQSEYRVRRADGTYRWVQGRAVPLKNADGSVREWVGTVTDIHDAKEASDAIARSERRLRFALAGGGMVAWEIDPVTQTMTHSGATAELYGLDSDRTEDYLKRIHPDDLPAVIATLNSSPQGATATVECRYLRPDGRVLWVELRCTRVVDGGVERVLGVSLDFTERKEAERKIAWIAHHDGLTGLPNRDAFAAELTRRIDDQQGSLALVMLDLDDFKSMNDTLGHHAGDHLLREAAARLKQAATDTEIVARIGGDEFALLLDQTDPGKALLRAGEFLELLRQPFAYQERTVISRASAGVAMSPHHAIHSSELMKAADLALYAAKNRGRNNAVMYAPQMQDAVLQRVRLMEEMRAALSTGKIIAHYQPIVCLETGCADAIEALARWQHPREGLVGPGAFMPVFDDPELGIGVGEAVIRHALESMRLWQQAGASVQRVAVNLSAAQLYDASLGKWIIRELNRAGLPGHCLEVEVTESVFLSRDGSLIARNLDILKRHGVRIALDDFGTGHASLVHLKEYPIDVIKIDQSFTRDLATDTGDAAIVSAVIRLGQALGLEIVAEGVETAEQLAFLQAEGCTFAQGYLFAKPLSASAIPYALEHADWERIVRTPRPRRSVA